MRRLAVGLMEESLTVPAGDGPAGGATGDGQLESALRALAAGELSVFEPLAAELEAPPLVRGADGVRVPFRPHPRTPKGKAQWREIKVAILARLGARLTREATRVTRLCQCR
jgi:hypothetical protein